MSDASANSDVAPATPGNLVEAGVYPTADDAFQHALVVVAMGRGCWLVPTDAGQKLLVEPTDLETVGRQLRSFDRESVGWPPVPEATEPARPLPLGTPVLWSLFVLAAYWGESFRPQWVAAGALDRDAVFVAHEWWRPFTALFLHADAGHLISNALSGVFVFSLVLASFGRLRGWLLLLLASVAGNAVTVALNYHVAYQSIGASTAVFAAVGLLTGAAVQAMRGVPPPHRVGAMFRPLASGVTVLALYGVGGVRVDVGAHCAGFLVGLVIGFVCAPRSNRDQAS